MCQGQLDCLRLLERFCILGEGIMAHFSVFWLN